MARGRERHHGERVRGRGVAGREQTKSMGMPQAGHKGGEAGGAAVASVCASGWTASMPWMDANNERRVGAKKPK